jgi:uncharacterized protein
VVGSVDTAEFAVSGAASLGFLFAIGASGIHWGFALALLAGGLIAAPLAAYLIKIAPAHLLGVAVGCFLFRQDPGLHRDPAGNSS